MSEREFLNLPEAAAFLRVGREWLRSSDCPRVRLGRRIVFYRDDLVEFALNRRTVVPETRLRVVPRAVG